MSLGKTIPLSDGTSIPQIGLGTWLSEPNEVENAVEIAVRNGYRHLDLARVYQNQEEVGRALKKVIPSVVKREELFITSKLWNDSHRPDLVEKALDETLEQLGIEYLDLYLIHWPVSFPPGRGLFPLRADNADEVEIDGSVSLVDTWKAMIALPKSKVRSVGVSNFTVEHLQGIIKATGVVPIVNQVEAHPYLPQDDLVEFCKAKNIHMTAYSPLGNNLLGKQQLTDNDTVKEVAQKLGATTAQVLVAWGAYRGYSVIPKSVKEERIKSNFQQVELSKEDYEKISVLSKTHVRFNPPMVSHKPVWSINLFDEEGEKGAKHQVIVGA
ncbi:aldehyde reductase 1 [Coprinopsis sp. MPI-PUGE-AT-0042]|nr:aldehyde reductase 1 [Coprinopsis sp. MPI-PUGE-AT-0042]